MGDFLDMANNDKASPTAGTAANENYFGPMVAFEDHHDTTRKNIKLPMPCVIPAGGTAQGDLSAALECLERQSNLAPFVS
jgi:hypothetical protein